MVNEWCEKMIEIVVEQDEEVMEVYLEGEELFVEKLCEFLCKGILVLDFVLVLGGFVFKNKGVQFLFNVVIDYLLFLLDVVDYMGFKSGDEIEICDIVCCVDDEMVFFGLVFKIMNDLFVGFLIFICIYFGMFEKGDILLNFIKGKKECIGCMMMMYFNNCEEIIEVFVGDIIVLVGLKDIIIGDMFCVVNDFVVLEIMIFLDLVIEIVVEFKIKVD